MLIDPVDVEQLVGFVVIPGVICGVGFTVTVVADGCDGQLPIVDVTTKVYVPLAATVTLLIVGFCNVLVKLFGPVHK